jgi:hypothetical protein
MGSTMLDSMICRLRRISVGDECVQRILVNGQAGNKARGLIALIK